MEQRKPELQKTPEPRREVARSRFRIVKLEERIAPRCGVNPHGKQTGHCR